MSDFCLAANFPAGNMLSKEVYDCVAERDLCAGAVYICVILRADEENDREGALRRNFPP